ncbi:endoribonuclease L-PSP [Annulohypoxylon stygium]|nr:endoribonuclease L-PSP [Annulohypoxylon stygium]
MFNRACSPLFRIPKYLVISSPVPGRAIVRKRNLSFVGTRRMQSTIQTIFTEKSYAPIGHYSQAFAANGQVWLAGQVAADKEGILIKGSVTEQTHQICKNMNEILKAANSSLEKVVKVTVYVSDFSILPEFNDVYNQYFPQKPPRTSMEVSKLPLGALIEVDVVAVI